MMLGSQTARDKLGGQKGKSPDLQLRSQSAASSGGEKLVGKTADNGVTVAIYRVAQKNKE